MERYYYKKDNGYYSFKEPILDDDSYVEITEEEFNSTINFVVKDTSEIENLKSELAQTDYLALKYMEGWLSEEEYKPIKAYRQSLRDRINALEEVK